MTDSGAAAGAGKILRVITVNAAMPDSASMLGRFRAMGLEDLPPSHFPDPPGQIVDTTLTLGPECNLSLVSPLSPESPMQRFIEKRGAGLASITVLVDNLEAIVESWSSAGVAWWQSAPHEFRDAEFGDMRVELARVNWTNPASLAGVAFEVVQFVGHTESRKPDAPHADK